MNKLTQTLNTSIANAAAMKMAVRIALVIIVMTVITYYHVVNIVTEQSLSELQTYIHERGQRDSELFLLAQDNHKVLKKQLLERFNRPLKPDTGQRFNSIFARFEDGVTRNRLEGFDGTRDAFAYIGKQVKIDTSLQHRLLTFLDLSNQFGPAWHHRLQNVYFTTPDNILVGYWPDVPNWAHDLSADFYMPDEEFIWAANPENNPERLTVWTGLYYDISGETWMVSVETPVDIDGKHVATIGHDITLNQLMDRTINDHPKGAYNIIFRTDGRLIAHPDKIEAIKAKAGIFNIRESDDTELKAIFEQASSQSGNDSVLLNEQLNYYIAVTKIKGPNWNLVTVYPKSLISSKAYSTATLVLFLGLISLVIEILVLMLILKNNVSKPIQSLVQTVENISQENYHDLPEIHRPDEIGKIARAISNLSEVIQTRTSDLIDTQDKLENKVKQQKQENVQVIESLTDNERRLYTILNTVEDGIITIDEKGIIDSFNPAAQKIFQYEVEEVIGKNISILMEENYQLIHDKHIDSYINTEQSKVLGQDRHLIGRRKNGQLIPLEITISDTALDGRHIIIGAVRDISKQVAIEDALRDAKLQADRANNFKSEFLSNMSHELRTPLNAIIGFTQLLQMDENLPTKQQDYLKEVYKAGDHLLGLINEVLDLTKIEVGQILLKPQKFILTELISACISITLPMALNRNISIDFVNNIDADDIVKMYTDNTRVKQILLNLLSNAVKYNKDGGSIHVSMDKISEKSVRIHVADTGIGISPTHLQDLFKPFVRINSEDSAIEGTGIGLTITKELVELLNGKIYVESTEDEGSHFWFELPIMIDETVNSDYLQQSNIVNIQTENQKNITVLYIEDNSANMMLIEHFFESLGNIRLISAITGEQGIQLAVSNLPDIILLDINLPDKSGYDVLNELKRTTSTQHIPVIAVTAKAMQNDIEKGLSQEFADYITKPVDLRKLQSVINMALQKSKPCINSA